MTMSQPREESSRAISAPIPEHEPLIIAVLPASVWGGRGDVVEAKGDVVIEVIVCWRSAL